MCFRWKGIDGSIIAILSLLACAGTAVPVFGQGATRDLPDHYCPDVTLTVSIDITAPGGTVAVALEDSPPAGWTTISNISDDGVYDADNHKVKWGPFFDNLSRTVTYEVTPPVGSSGQKCFQGVISFDGMPTTAVGGDQCIPGPDCTGRECGLDPNCGTSCGTCTPPETCVSGTCVCIPDCTGRECGPDPNCGTSCGTCTLPETCVSGTCVCIPDCTGRECGPDGCGGSCGECPPEELCNHDGECVPGPAGVPTLSESTLAALTLLLLCAGTLVFLRRRPAGV